MYPDVDPHYFIDEMCLAHTNIDAIIDQMAAVDWDTAPPPLLDNRLRAEQAAARANHMLNSDMFDVEAYMCLVPDPTALYVDNIMNKPTTDLYREHCKVCV
jgi:hypothetical protein